MIKVICIKEDTGKLIKGKIYDSEWKIYSGFRLINETGWISTYPEEYVIPLAEWRDRQINAILDE